MSQQIEPLISLKSAGVYRAKRWLIRDINLEVYPGEIVTLIGPNGSGKSTTLKTAIGLEKPDEGQARRKKDLTIGYVPQKFHIDGTMPLTVRRLMSLTKSYPNDLIEETLKSVGVLEYIDASVQTLSGGELQRALIARAFIAKPDLLVLDEPVQGVDYAGEAALYDMIEAFRAETGCGILLISHDLHVVMAKTDRVLCLNGHVCCTGTPERVVNDPQYLELFGARATESVALYRHDHDHTHLVDGRVMHKDGSITDHCHNHDGHHDHSAEKGGDHAG
ncbi:zinc transporter subunit: ATP-binding component of ABC superfamily [Candidatus Terasakiella magnetica]|uniref:Zinc transporter subunit: ATP-binding component of ABC superfamily n=1 Tax=Candidatus Terasakiella magnetica TaxID=1867952 RepID=A0A1C3RFJ7_9PROT|nr:metal ABC transporter ATP-binding protein [Candidatus Terasakiella magnetica]SCA55984.1 zinc transporter subunit: ATP-binding component of ABC superfamily [Candidatus Terasakiella magnetica]